jgi:hypothetical protein
MPKQTGRKTKTSSRKNARKGDESTTKVTLIPHGRIVSRHPTTIRRTVDLDAIYGILGDGTGDYTRTPVDNSDFAKFKATPSAVAEVTSQSKWPVDDALQQGDYFHVENKNASEYRMSSDEKKGLLERRARRGRTPRGPTLH